ncbi:MAG: hypothetical protein PUI06_04220 [Prevotella sp.]|nr:hypothetical protein [Prevotella sp.]MDY5667289.1 hypothetical protein [Alloprevotella sp.]
MKRIILFLLTLCCIIPASAQLEKKIAKQMEQEYKKTMKLYKKEGWKLFGSSHSIEMALLLHYQKLYKAGEENQEIVGNCTRCKSKNVGHQTCINNAANIYAQQAKRVVSGRVASDIANSSDEDKAEFDRFYAAYESQVEKEINGELQETYCLIRPIGNGEYEMEAHFIVSESAATRARIKAYENAARESKAAQKYADEVSKFIREGRNKDTNK